jgi:hypothetical protein
LACVSGDLPLADAARISKNPVVFVRTALDVSAPGVVRFELADSGECMLWVDGLNKRFAENACQAELAAGRHVVWLRVDTSRRATPQVRVELKKPAGSTVQFTVPNSRDS